jgi:hypothetical protein
MRRIRRCLAFIAMTGSLCAVDMAIAEDTAPTADRDTNSALRVVRDAETGELRAPTPQELRQLIEAEQAARSARRASAARATSTTAPQVLPEQQSVQRHPNGMVSVRLSQDSLTAIRSERDSEGKARIVHTPHAGVTRKEGEK